MEELARKVLAACGREPSRWMRQKRLEEIEARLQREEAFVVLYCNGQRTWLQRRNVHAED